ncbi:MAG: flagellar biosynthetic protein FliO [Candidatus Binatia bacterium]
MFSFNFKQRAPSRQDVGGRHGLGALVQRFIPALSRRGNLAGTLEHLGTMPLTAQSSLAVVRLHNETLLLGITPQSITLLAKGNESTAHANSATDRPPDQKGMIEP